MLTMFKKVGKGDGKEEDSAKGGRAHKLFYKKTCRNMKVFITALLQVNSQINDTALHRSDGETT